MSQRHVPGPCSTSLTGTRRAQDLAWLADGHEVDVLVIGGGVTGAGVALDAASRGLSVALLERGDLAQGTSRWSSKLAHGGLRYLAHGDVGVAWESARERAILADRTAPHLIRALPMLTPLTPDVGRAQATAIHAGLRAGDGLRRAAGTSAKRLPPARRIPAAEALRWAPALQPAGLRGALLAWDGQLEDDARLVVGLARTAAGHGARILTGIAVEHAHGGGAEARDARTGATLSVRARHVVSATGVWAGQVVPGVAVTPSRGSHLLIPSERLGDPAAAVNVPLPGHFGRFAIVVPRPDGLVLVGLTDAPADRVEDAPAVPEADERFLLDAVAAAFDRPLRTEDVVGRFAGLRPLLGRAGSADAGTTSTTGTTADLSRRHAVLEDPATGVLSVVGGKLTTYRRMAQDAVDRVAARPGVAAGPCRTRSLPLVGAQPQGSRASAGVPARLVRRYGAEAGAVAALADGRPELLAPLAPGVPYCGAELRFAVAHEGALSLGDVLERRTRVGLVPAWRAAVEERAAALLPDLTDAPTETLR